MSVEELEKYVANGIINWGEPVRNIMEDGALAVNQVRTSERTPLVTVLLSGEHMQMISDYGIKSLGSIHTCDLLGVNYCVNLPLNNGLYIHSYDCEVLRE